MCTCRCGINLSSHLVHHVLLLLWFKRGTKTQYNTTMLQLQDPVPLLGWAHGRCSWVRVVDNLYQKVKRFCVCHCRLHILLVQVPSLVLFCKTPCPADSATHTHEPHQTVGVVSVACPVLAVLPVRVVVGLHLMVSSKMKSSHALANNTGVSARIIRT